MGDAEAAGARRIAAANGVNARSAATVRASLDDLPPCAAAAAASSHSMQTPPAAAAAASQVMQHNGPPPSGSLVAWQLRQLATIMLPLLVQNAFSFLVPVVSTAFVGHLGPDVLASVVLASSLFNVTGNSVIVGLSAGMETLCGQAYGARNYKMLGLVLQRAMLVLLVCCIPIIALWFNMEPLLLQMHQAPAVAAGAARYLHLVWPTLIATVVSNVVYRYLLAQQQVAPSTACSIVSALLCPVFNWYLIFKLNLGLDGAAYANLLSQGTTSVLMLLYVVYRETTMCWAGDPQSTWPGWQIARALEPGAVLQYLSYGGAAAAMICLEWWAFELIIILSGTVKDDADIAVSTMGVTFLISSFLYMFPMAAGTSVNTRIANELGAGNPKLARQALVVALSVVFVMVCCFNALLWLLRNRVADVFTDDAAVANMVSSVVPVMCLGVIGDGLNATFGGALRGSGRQGLGALLNLVGWWVIVVPLATFLGIYHGLGPWGFWLALSSGSTFQAMVFAVVLLRFDWNKEVERAQALVATHADKEQDGVLVDGQMHAEDGLQEPLLSNSV